MSKNSSQNQTPQGGNPESRGSFPTHEFENFGIEIPVQSLPELLSGFKEALDQINIKEWSIVKKLAGEGTSPAQAEAKLHRQGYSRERTRLIAVVLLFLLSFNYLVACSGISAFPPVVVDGGQPRTSEQSPTQIVLEPTNPPDEPILVVPSSTPTEKPSPTPEPTAIPYDQLTVEQKWELANACAAEINGFAGKVEGKTISIGGKTYRVGWDMVKKEWQNLDNPATNLDNIDLTGESFEPLALPVIVNEDGSISVKLPNGQEKVFPATVAWPGGEINIVELSAMSQKEIAQKVVDVFLQGFTRFGPGDVPYETAKETEKNSVFLPVFRIEKQTDVYPILVDLKTGDFGKDEYAAIRSLKTNPVMTLIYSPETGEPLCGLVLYAANSERTDVYDIDETGAIQMSYLGHPVSNNFGGKQRLDDDVGIIQIYKDPLKMNREGRGEKPLLNGGEGIAGVEILQKILTAKTDAEIFALLEQYRLILVNAERIVIPEEGSLD